MTLTLILATALLCHLLNLLHHHLPSPPAPIRTKTPPVYAELSR
jgi:hypothetical protein